MYQDEQEDKKQITTTKTVTKSNDSEVAVNNYQMKPFTPEMEAAALKAAQESSAFKSLMNKRSERLKQQGARVKSAEDAAKTLAWTNLFTNLAKIAGMGNAPVVGEQTGFLSDAFAQADALRKSYYAKDDEYENMLDKYKTSYVDAARAAHLKAETEKYKAESQRVKDQNLLGRENTTTTTTTVEDNPYKQAQEQREQELHPLKKQQVIAQTNSANASAAKAASEAEKGGKNGDKVIYTYANAKDGYSYQITRSDALKTKQKLLALSAKATNEDLKQKLDDDIAFLGEAYKYGGSDAALAEIVAKYLDEYPEEFADILNRSKRTKTRSNTYQFEAESDNSKDVSTLIK